jgi:hypothetical protein
VWRKFQTVRRHCTVNVCTFDVSGDVWLYKRSFGASVMACKQLPVPKKSLLQLMSATCEYALYVFSHCGSIEFYFYRYFVMSRDACAWVMYYLVEFSAGMETRNVAKIQPQSYWNRRLLINFDIHFEKRWWDPRFKFWPGDWVFWLKFSWFYAVPTIKFWSSTLN